MATKRPHLLSVLVIYLAFSNVLADLSEILNQITRNADKTKRVLADITAIEEQYADPINNYHKNLNFMKSTEDDDPNLLDKILASHHSEVIQTLPKNNGANVLLVRRPVPIGHESKLEYNPQEQSLFVPLYINPRYLEETKTHHKKLKIKNENNALTPKSKEIYLELQLPDLNMELPRNRYKKRLQKELNNVEDFQNDDVLNRLKLFLRNNKGRAMVPENNEAAKAPTAQLHYPHYSLWNFWTYNKALTQDQCPDNQMMLNGICIGVPPHRRYLEQL